MSISKRKHRLERIMYSKLTLAFILICCFFLSLSVYERYSKAREMEARRIESEAAYSDLEDRREQLQQKVEYLEGKQGIESEIRRNFDVAREGEAVVIIVDDEEAGPSEPQEGTDSEEKQGFWSRLFTW